MTETQNSKHYDLEKRTLVDTKENAILEKERQNLIKEATELMMIFSSIMRKSV